MYFLPDIDTGRSNDEARSCYEVISFYKILRLIENKKLKRYKLGEM
jgi:hypothetical protein